MTIPVFVNEKTVVVPIGSPAVDAVTAHDASLGEAVAAERAYLTDGRGIRLDPGSTLTAGAIVRVVTSARRTADAPEG